MITLKVQTEYSFGKVYAPLSEVISRLKEQGVTAAGIVDNDTWGHVKWFKACKQAGIRPLLGVSVVVSDYSDTAPCMWFLARNTQGLSELYNAVSSSYVNQLSTKRGLINHLTVDHVVRMSNNILKFAGDIVNTEWLQRIYERNPDTFFIDISENGSSIANRLKRDFSARTGAPVVYTRDNLYLSEEDREVPEYLPFGRSFPGDMSLCPPEHQTETMTRIADLCADLTLPKAPMISVPGDLETLCRAAIPERFPHGWSEEYEMRLRHELTEIKAKNFDSYFLLVRDMVTFAKQHMLVGPSRGSAAGSLVCYLLHITEIDPLPPGLYFERFIDKTRTDLPDIDLDFPDTDREFVIKYLSDKYGYSNVAHVGNVSSFKPKSALIQVCKTLNIPQTATPAVKSAIIERAKSDPRFNRCLEDTFATTVPGKEFIRMYPEARVAGKLEGHAVRSGIHAAGVLVCNAPISDFCTVDNKGVAHIDKHDLEDLNLLKIDLLGLRTLTVLQECGIEVDWYHLPLNDPKTFALLNSGRYSGIFQFEGTAMRKTAEQVEFRSLTEIDAVTALARPGPLNTGVTGKWIERHNGQRYELLHPLISRLLSRSYDLPLYQEDTMSLCREIGGFTWEQVTTVRKAISKSKGRQALEDLTQIFISGAISHGVPEPVAVYLWDQITAMGAWQMNKAHTYSYAVVSYWTAWIKANYPLHFAASTLRHAKDQESAVALLRELVSEGYSYVYFDPERSEVDWSVIDGQLIGGFTAINGVGINKAIYYVSKRREGKLSYSDVQKLYAAGSVFQDVYALTHKYEYMYKGHANIRGTVYFLKDIPEGLPNGAERVFIGEVTERTSRDMNEEVLLKKRGRKYLRKATAFMDLCLRDDTGEIKGRIGAEEFAQKAEYYRNEVVPGRIVLIRAKFFRGFRYAFITKLRVLS